MAVSEETLISTFEVKDVLFLVAKQTKLYLCCVHLVVFDDFLHKVKVTLGHILAFIEDDDVKFDWFLWLCVFASNIDDAIIFCSFW